MGNNFLRLLGGLWITVKISMLAVILSIILGILMGLLMTLKNPVVKVLTKFYLEFIRIMPQLVLLFLVYFGATKTFGIQLSGQVSAVIVFTMWGTAEMGDLVRGALISIPKHQYESGAALGMENYQIYRYIIIPQTFRRLIPLAINLATRMIKTTSLIVMIGVVEVLKVGQQIIEANRYTVPDSALWIYGTIFFLYFIVCWPVSRLAAWMEKKWAN
jgi:polar amino acid transport system permease protein